MSRPAGMMPANGKGVCEADDGSPLDALTWLQAATGAIDGFDGAPWPRTLTSDDYDFNRCEAAEFAASHPAAAARQRRDAVALRDRMRRRLIAAGFPAAELDANARGYCGALAAALYVMRMERAGDGDAA